MLNSMQDWLFTLDHPAGVIYLILFFLLMAGAVGFPVPEDLPLLAGGVFVHHGAIDWRWGFLTCYLGVLSGDLVIFLIGKRLGPSLFEKRWFKSRFPPRKVKAIRVKLERRSLITIFVARHLFYLRTATFLTCGAVKMRLSRFLLADAIAALISVPLMMFLGFKFSEQLDTARDVAHLITEISLVIVIFLAIAYLFYLYRKKHPEIDEKL